ncbi:MAG TPA: hypothetical protein DHW61_01685 [Lachnoclostridium phytofermentans]|uniref:Uncharacterized protein n=1 Tax=Lachnoclostridium phytofermentans TaxID=66219 RepID=A0A3D2X1V2_9FIRM|nr:hypothetical protein [Lachnoclostridium sp.]HCL01121.1 hypothetical protein [Lachnoclostridium phytofermentans]
MKEIKEEYSYIVRRNKESKHRGRVKKAITIFTTLSLLVGSFLMFDQLAPQIAFSKEEDTESVDQAKVKSVREISLFDSIEVTVPAAELTTVKPLTNDGTMVNVRVDYTTEKLFVSSSNSSKFYFSQDKMKTWERISDTSLTNGIDVSIFLKTSDSIIYFKGNNDKAIAVVTLPKEDKDFKVSYYVDKGVGKLKFENQTRPVEYRKGPNGKWDDCDSNLVLSSYEITGYTLQFRLKAIPAFRAGKIVNVKIPKREAPPKITVDYSKMEVSGLKAGSTYYYNNKGELKLFAPADAKVKTLSLYNLLSTTPNTQFTAASVEFYTAGTDKKVASSTIVVEIQGQPQAPTGNVFALDKTTVTFPQATKTTPYEYVVLHQGENLDLSKVKWTKVTTNKSFEIKKVGKATPAPGDVIYYRLASTINKETKVVTPASVYVFTPITNVPITK